MGLRDVIAKGVNAAYVALGDIPLDTIVRHYAGTKIRDMDTGTYSTTYVDFVAKGIYLELTDEESRANSAEAIRKVVIRASEVPVISIGDIIFDGSLVFEVLSVSSDPTDQAREAILRKSAEKINFMSTFPQTGHRVFYGHGFPISVPGAVAGDFYVDDDTGIYYELA